VIECQELPWGYIKWATEAGAALSRPAFGRKAGEFPATNWSFTHPFFANNCQFVADNCQSARLFGVFHLKRTA
jgi:hypothetical protein